MYNFLKEDFKDTGRTFNKESVYKKGNTNLILMDTYPIFFDTFTKSFTPDVTIYASKHTAASKIPSLTVHSIGVYTNDTSLGGQAQTLGHAVPVYKSELLRQMTNWQNPKYDVTYEVTHHGPVLPTKPVIFAEMGSDLTGWKNEKAAEFMSQTIQKILKPLPKKREIAIGIGGQHYPKKFTKLALDGEYDFGHMIPRYATKEVTQDLLKQMITKSTPRPTIAIIDKQSTNKRGQIKEWLKEENIDLLEI